MEYLERVLMRLSIMLLLVLVNVCHGCREQERIALLQLKDSINHPNGSSLPSWEDWDGEEPTDCCEWEGVECNATTRRIIKLSLNSTREYELGDWYLNTSVFLPFESLVSLDLRNNVLLGCIKNEGFEKLSRLSNLHILDLSENYFNNSILSSLNGLSSLKTIKLYDNNLTGQVYIEDIDGLNNLKELNISWNRLESIVSREGFEKLSGLSNLQILDLSGNFLNNSILSSLSGLSSLNTLKLQQNNLIGQLYIQDFDGLNNLKELDISRNDLASIIPREGLERSPSLNNLEILDLSDNLFNNDIWSFLQGLPSLKTLYMIELNVTIQSRDLHNLTNVENLFLDNATLSKDFLPSIQVMTSLKVLSLQHCRLTGAFPSTGLCELKNLQELDLHDNKMEGDLPQCMENMTSLRFLDLSFNQFTGNIASAPLVHLTSLEYLALSNNNFKIPIFFRSFFNHSKLKVIDSLNNELLVETEFDQTLVGGPSFQLIGIRLSDREFGNVKSSSTGAFPNFLYYQKDLQQVELSRVNFKGMLPNWLLDNNTRLVTLLLPNNSFTGPFQLPLLPKTGLLALDISKNHFCGNIPENIAMAFPGLKFLNMSLNDFGGTIPSSLGDMSSLRLLDLSNNQLSGEIPDHLAMGCFLLRYLKLSYNNLQGLMLPRKSNLTRLSFLYLDNNNFTKISSSLSISSELRSLNTSTNHLSGKLPGWMGSMSYLRYIDMSGNHLEGPIPTEFCQLFSLRVFQLSQNNITGTIPSCFNLEDIERVHLSNNRLQGPFPRAFFNSSSLEILDLSYNNFTGHILNMIVNGTLSRLRILLLKSNRFEGEIPTNLCGLTKLRVIDLSHNNFSGSIPPCLSHISVQGPTQRTMPSFQIIPYLQLSEFTLFLVELKLMSKGRHNIYYDSIFIVRTKAQVVFTIKRVARSYKGINLDLFSAIDLSCNKLTGHIPHEFGNQGEIKSLNLSHNALSGTIPTTFSNLNNIESLDLSFNNLSGEIPSVLTTLHFLAEFNVSYNNLSGSIPRSQSFVQFDTFGNSSYIGNPHLCGPPLSRICTATIEPRRIIMNCSEVDGGFMDMESFYVSFAVSYIIMLLGIAAVFYLNPYWRRAWIHLVEVCATSCYYFVVDNFRKVFCQGYN